MNDTNSIAKPFRISSAAYLPWSFTVHLRHEKCSSKRIILRFLRRHWFTLCGYFAFVARTHARCKQKVFDLGYSKRVCDVRILLRLLRSAAFKHGLIGDLQMTWKRDGYDLDALKARDEEDKLKIQRSGVLLGRLRIPPLPPFSYSPLSILLSTERAEEKYTALILPLLQRKGAIIDNPFATIIIAFVATLVFRFMLLRRNIANVREEAKKLAKDRLATMCNAKAAEDWRRVRRRVMLHLIEGFLHITSLSLFLPATALGTVFVSSYLYRNKTHTGVPTR